jgi:hypothetical protein
MTIQAYLQIENNVVTNSVMWDGDTTNWQPPSDAIMLIQADTQALVWELNIDKTDYVLVEELGQGQIGFTWDGTVLTTNQLKPPKPQPQPTTTGTQTA